jgi:hypothetical protein
MLAGVSVMLFMPAMMISNFFSMLFFLSALILHMNYSSSQTL